MFTWCSLNLYKNCLIENTSSVPLNTYNLYFRFVSVQNRDAERKYRTFPPYRFTHNLPYSTRDTEKPGIFNTSGRQVYLRQDINQLIKIYNINS